MAKLRERTQKRTKRANAKTKRRNQRGGSWMRLPTFTHELSSTRYQPLQQQQTPAEQGGISTRIVGGRRSRRQRFSLRRRQSGGGLLSTGGFADFTSAYGAGAGTAAGAPSQGAQFATIPPITTANVHPNGSVVSQQM